MLNNIIIEKTCPLGSECEAAGVTSEGKPYIKRCAWYTEVQGIDQQGNRQDQMKCAMEWMPILTLEMAGTNRGQTEAIESLRDESVRATSAVRSTLEKAMYGNQQSIEG